MSEGTGGLIRLLTNHFGYNNANLPRGQRQHQFASRPAFCRNASFALNQQKKFMHTTPIKALM